MKDEQSSRAYARCKACNRRYYPKWNIYRKEFESLCWSCKPIAIAAALTDPVLYDKEYSPAAWSEHKSFVQGYVEDKQQLTGDLLDGDEYTEYGEGAMGDLGWFDSYE